MKNLKKGLAVAMSLAMVATVLPVNVTNVNAAACATGSIETAEEAVAVIKALKEGTDLSTLNPTDGKVAAADVVKMEKIIACGGLYSAYVDDAQKIIDVYNVNPNDGSKNKVFAYENAAKDLLLNVGELGDEVNVEFTTATNPDTLPAKGTELTFAIPSAAQGTKEYTLADGALVTRDIADKAEYTILAGIVKTLEGDFKGNVSATLKAAVNKYLPTLKTLVDNYKEDNFAVALADYVKSLKEEDITGLTTTTKTVEFVLGKDAIPYSNASKIETFIKAVKDPKDTTLSLDGKYADFEDEEDVIEIVDGLQTVVDDMKAAKKLVEGYASNTDYTDYKTEIENKVDALAVVADADAFDAELYKAGGIKTDEIAKIKTFVEEIVNEFYEVNKTKRTNGSYRVILKDGEKARFIDSTVKDTLVKGELDKLLTNVYDKEEGTTYYEELIAVSTTIEKAIKAITDGIKGVTTSNLSAANVSKVIAADKAYETLTGAPLSAAFTGNTGSWGTGSGSLTGGNTGTSLVNNMTASQVNKVNSKISTLKNLIAKMYALGLESTETKTGWVNLGNGNWDFFNEDGTASTKWVAAGKLWYFVKDGHMLRNSWVAQDATGKVWYYVNDKGEMVTNTTIDGYVINANGEWYK